MTTSTLLLTLSSAFFITPPWRTSLVDPSLTLGFHWFPGCWEVCLPSLPHTQLGLQSFPRAGKRRGCATSWPAHNTHWCAFFWFTVCLNEDTALGLSRMKFLLCTPTITQTLQKFHFCTTKMLSKKKKKKKSTTKPNFVSGIPTINHSVSH